VKILLACLALVVLAVGGFLAYLQSKLSVITADPAVRLRVERFLPRKMEGETRRIDLGFSTFALPSRLAGIPVQMHGTLFVNIATADSRPLLTIGPPISDHDESVRKLLSGFAPFGDPPASWFEAHRRVVEVQPFNVFGAIAKGRAAAIRDVTYLTLKIAFFGAADDSVRIFESDLTGAFIYRSQSGLDVGVFDKTSGISQLFIISSEAEGLDELVSVIVQTYRARTDARTEKEFLERLRATGIENIPAPGGTTASESENKLLNEMADEVRRLRAKRSP
jgi:hypothetical protein